jgi:hypothetical protein
MAIEDLSIASVCPASVCPLPSRWSVLCQPSMLLQVVVQDGKSG